MTRWLVKNGLVRILTAADSTRADVITAIGEASNDPRFVRGMGLLVDVRGMDPKPELLPHRIRASATAVASLGYGRCAIVAESPQRVEQGQIFAAYAELRELDTAVFPDEDQALRWLRAPAS
jgi:hypothetical protein